MTTTEKKHKALSKAMQIPVGMCYPVYGMRVKRTAGNVFEVCDGKTILTDAHGVAEICIGVNPAVVWPKNVLDTPLATF